MSSSEVFGINLGSCNATIAVHKSGRCEVLASESGEREIPVMVTYQRNAKLVGVPAKQGLYRNVRNTAVAMTTLLEANFADPSLKELISALNCKVIQREREICYELVYQDEGTVIVPVKEALGEVLQQLAATARLSTSITPIPCVIAVPSSYTNTQKESLKVCAESVGFNVLLTTSQASLALLPYNCTQDSGRVLVYDMGMRTITVTLINYSAGLFRTILTKVACNIGGILLDKALMSILSEECQRIYGHDITENQRSFYKLLNAAESTKHTLTTVDTSAVYVESLHSGQDLQCNVARGRFEGVCQPVFQLCVSPIQEVLTSVKLTEADINKVLVVGGGCKVPRIMSLLMEKFPNSTILSSISCDHVVAMGAAMQCSISSTQETIEFPTNRGLPCVPRDLWICCDNCTDPVSSLLLPQHTPLPCSKMATLCPEPDKLSDHVLLQLREDNTVVAEVKVPSSGVVLNIHVELIWNSSDISNHMITLNITEKTTQWSVSIPLSIE